MKITVRQPDRTPPMTGLQGRAAGDSPTHMYVTGSAARQGVKAWTLEARGNVILGENFSVKMGETLTVRVNVSK